MSRFNAMKQSQTRSEPKTKLLDAAMGVIRAKGYTAATVEDICAAAGVTKGSFFHHFKTKEQLAIEAAAHFGKMASGLFDAPYRQAADPLDRVLGYIDLRIAILKGELGEFTCLLGTMVQEVYDTHPKIRAACDLHISEHAAEVTKDIEAAKKLYAPDLSWSAESLSLHTQAVIQGALLLAKAKHGPEVAVVCLGHLRRYLELLFTNHASQETSQAFSADQQPRV
jgi:TetR/AcrR family transcriptional repressor of nem operon